MIIFIFPVSQSISELFVVTNFGKPLLFFLFFWGFFSKWMEHLKTLQTGFFTILHSASIKFAQGFLRFFICYQNRLHCLFRCSRCLHWSDAQSRYSPHQSCLLSPTRATRQRCEQIWYLTSPRCGSSQQSFSRLHPESFLKGFFSGINHVIKLPVSFPKFSARFENVIQFKDFRKTLDICFNSSKFFRHHLDLLAHYVISEQVSTSDNIKKAQQTDRQTWTASAIPCRYILTVCWVDP